MKQKALRLLYKLGIQELSNLLIGGDAGGGTPAAYGDGCCRCRPAHGLFGVAALGHPCQEETGKGISCPGAVHGFYPEGVLEGGGMRILIVGAGCVQGQHAGRLGIAFPELFQNLLGLHSGAAGHLLAFHLVENQPTDLAQVAVQKPFIKGGGIQRNPHSLMSSRQELDGYVQFLSRKNG